MRNFHLHFSLILMAVLFILIGQAAYAQPNCIHRNIVGERLTENFGETVHSRGLSPSGQAIVETWVNQETGSWTITVTKPSGMSCLVASGQMFEVMPQEAQGEPL